jgi:pimeloyl-ACP methyl ester carboxylesterase
VLAFLLLLPTFARTQELVITHARLFDGDSVYENAALAEPAQGSAESPVGLQRGVTFTEYSPLAANSEMVRRLYSPLAAAEIERMVARSGNKLIEQSIDLAQERFTDYVPAHAPPQGYGLLVFIPPWQEAGLPRRWAEVFEQHGVIFVSAARSGNDEEPFTRREPLALLAAHNIMQRYPVNREHVFIGGLSGGSRIALRVALGYPDLFRGALLNAGSDPLDAVPPIIPPRELFAKFQEATRIVFVTGERDEYHLSLDGLTRQSMRHWCVFDVDSEVERGVGHEPATPAALSRALEVLLRPPAPVPRQLASCRADIERDLAARLDKARALAAEGKRDAAQKLLLEIDRHYGGLAAPGSLELQAALTPSGP